MYWEAPPQGCRDRTSKARSGLESVADHEVDGVVIGPYASAMVDDEPVCAASMVAQHGARRRRKGQPSDQGGVPMGTGDGIMGVWDRRLQKGIGCEGIERGPLHASMES